MKMSWQAFSGCNSLTSAIIPDRVTNIGEDVFAYCSNLTSVVIGDSVTSIRWRTFLDCENLTSVVIGNSVTSIEGGTFQGCNKITSVYYKGSSRDWRGISIGALNGRLTSATRYYYSENQPTTSGNYWRYVDGVPTVWA